MFRKFFHRWSWIILLVFCIAGIFNTAIGVIAIICMLAPVSVAFLKGRLWCGYFCPRGSFNDMILAKISARMKIPKFMKKQWFRLFFLALVMSGFTIQLVFAWGNITLVGAVFVRMIIITTILSIVLGILFSHRTWCSICPMGTMAHYVSKARSTNSKKKHITFNKNTCVNCNLCTKSCPLEIDVLKHKDHGKVIHNDCMRCGVCVERCPKKSLDIK